MSFMKRIARRKELGMAVAYFAEEDVESARMSACQSCKANREARCSVDGAMLRYKVKLKGATCPQQKW